MHQQVVLFKDRFDVFQAVFCIRTCSRENQRESNQPFQDTVNRDPLGNHRLALATRSRDSLSSLGFQRLKDCRDQLIPVRCPRLVVGHRHVRFEKHVEATKDLQEKLEELLDVENKSFSDKKKITSAIRRVFPQGMKTTLVWTANARTLRWVIESRTAPSYRAQLNASNLLNIPHSARLGRAFCLQKGGV